ncbi:MAG: adenosylcobinamide-phosphate synthase CbiB [Clostridiales bacterium]|nr:adenosylcobinamide-phosphate synthase CbiB [Clostridiales bacterium]
MKLAMIGLGVLWDACVGDPPGWWHPVRAIGNLITFLESKLRSLFPRTPKGELCGGAVFAVVVPAICAAVGTILLRIAWLLHPFCHFLASILLSGQLLAARSLRDESMMVCERLEAGNVEGARTAVSRIVGRDTERLDEEGIAKAAVETVAENASDGVIAPLFYLFLSGPVGMLFYKAVNTMDSMIGYRNDRYLYFGRAAARLDDLVNLIPARITALSMIATAWVLPGFDGRDAYRIWRRDRRCHKSPNSAQSESACAGALGVRLAGDAWYFGKRVFKPTIGDAKRPVCAGDIRRANRLMLAASGVALAGFSALTVLTGRMRSPRR